jgi:hypothetical protein
MRGSCYSRTRRFKIMYDFWRRFTYYFRTFHRFQQKFLEYFTRSILQSVHVVTSYDSQGVLRTYSNLDPHEFKVSIF